jgi:hypothetical protein
MSLTDLETRIQSTLQEFDTIKKELAAKSPDERQQMLSAIEGSLSAYDEETRQAILRIIHEVLA